MSVASGEQAAKDRLLAQGPPKVDDEVLQPGTVGWGAWALQRALLALGYKLPQYGADGYYLAAGETEIAVRSFQREEGLWIDGIAGGATQARIGNRLADKVDLADAVVPDRYLRGLLLSESGLKLVVVNDSVPGGLDEGLAQIRCYLRSGKYDPTEVLTAMDPLAAVREAARRFREARDELAGFAWAKVSRERLGRCAALSHNWPVGARSQAQYGHVPDPASRASWIPRYPDGTTRVHFADGTPVETKQQWAEFYALGSAHGPGATTRFVTSW